MGLFSRRAASEPAGRAWARGTKALARSTRLSDPAALAALERACNDGETILGVVDGVRLYVSDMRQVEGTTVLTDVRLVFVEVNGKRPKTDSILVSDIHELGARRGYFEIVLAAGPPSDLNAGWLQVGPEEHLSPFAALVMSSPNYAGDR